jgi:hypothetical protein
MCCYIDETYTKKRITRLKSEGKKFIWGWKVLDVYGGALYGSYNYKAGINKLATNQEQNMKDYRINNPAGFHFYLTKLNDWDVSGRVIKVKILVSDIFGLESVKTHKKHIGNLPRQGVARKLQILKSDWIEGDFYERYWLA